MVNKTLLPPRVQPGKTPNLFKILNYQTWHNFRSVTGEPRLGRALAVRTDPQTAWEGLMRIVEGENYRWRMRFSSDFRGRWCWNGKWMSSPTMSRTSTPTVTKATSRCFRNT